MLPTAVVAAFAADLPFEGNRYPGVPLATCRGVSCKGDREKRGVYYYTAKYSDENADPEDEEPGTDDNPLNDRPIIKPNAGMQQRAIHRDRNDQLIQNTAGDPILQSMDDNIVGLRISVNVASLPLWILSYRNTSNDAPIVVGGLAIDTNMARFILPDDYISERKNRNDIGYHVFTFALDLDERDRHNGTPLNAGFRQRVLDPSKPSGFRSETIVNEDGSEPTEPVALDEFGARFPEGEVDPDSAIYLSVGRYPEADYSVLPGVN